MQGANPHPNFLLDNPLQKDHITKALHLVNSLTVQINTPIGTSILSSYLGIPA